MKQTRDDNRKKIIKTMTKKKGEKKKKFDITLRIVEKDRGRKATAKKEFRLYV